MSTGVASHALYTTLASMPDPVFSWCIVICKSW